MSVLAVSSLIVGGGSIYGLKQVYDYMFNIVNEPSVEMSNLEKKDLENDNEIIFDSLSSEYKLCTSCKVNKSKEEFSNRQFKSNKKARCKVCIDKG